MSKPKGYIKYTDSLIESKTVIANILNRHCRSLEGNFKLNKNDIIITETLSKIINNIDEALIDNENLHIAKNNNDTIDYFLK